MVGCAPIGNTATARDLAQRVVGRLTSKYRRSSGYPSIPINCEAT
jgi:hypothetical protein